MDHMNGQPDNEDIQHYAGLAAYALAHGAPAYACSVEPGNGTRYIMLLTALTKTHGNPSMIGGIEDHYVLSLPYFQTSYPVNLPGYLTADYVAKKWTRDNLVDAQVVADFLNAISRGLRTVDEADLIN